MCLKIDDVDFTFGYVEDDDFLFVEHAEGVEDIFVLILPQNLATAIEMDEALLLAWLVDP